MKYCQAILVLFYCVQNNKDVNSVDFKLTLLFAWAVNNLDFKYTLVFAWAGNSCAK